MEITYAPGEPAALASQFINNTSQHVFLTGNAGTGKTTFLKYIIRHTHKKTAIVAPTGIAALNAGGVTIHSFFQLPFGSFVPVKKLPFVQGSYGRIHDHDSVIKNLQMHENKRKIIRELELLIIDEVSMLRADLLDALEFVLRFVRRRMNEPFGGVQLLFIGDMLQLPPVVKEEEWNSLQPYYKSAFFFHAQAIEKTGLVYLELEKIYRQQDNRFISLLNNLRNNIVTVEDAQLLNSHFKPSFKAAPDEGYITLTTHNYKADKINKTALEQLQAKAWTYEAQVEGDFQEYMYPVESSLILKKGAQVMFLKNDPSGQQKYYNGKIATVVDLDDEFIDVQSHGETNRIRVDLYEWENNKYTLNDKTQEIETKKVGSFKHYPLKLAWAITVHKSQGLTFDKAVIDVQDAFAAGQIYVALSRLRSLDGLVLTSQVPSNAFRIEQSVIDFGKTKPEKEQLEILVKERTFAFLHYQLDKAFNFAHLVKTLRDHANSYDKSEVRSVKQSYAKWAVDLALRSDELKKTAEKFLQQMNYTLQQKEEGFMAFMQQRLTAAMNYYTPLLRNLSVDIFKLIKEIGEEKGVKEYVEELQDVEAVIYGQLQHIRKCEALTRAIAEDRELQKDAIKHYQEDSERFALVDRAAELLQASKRKRARKEEPADDGTPKRETKRERKAKPAKGATQKESLRLFKEGNSIIEIARMRALTSGTIFTHLASFVLKDELSVYKLVPEEKMKAIFKELDEQPDILATPLKEKLGDAFTFDEIRLAMQLRIKDRKEVGSV